MCAVGSKRSPRSRRKASRETSFSHSRRLTSALRGRAGDGRWVPIAVALVQGHALLLGRCRCGNCAGQGRGNRQHDRYSRHNEFLSVSALQGNATRRDEVPRPRSSAGIRPSRQPGAEQPTKWRSQNQADDNEGRCHRELVPTALPCCWSAGQSGHAGHGVRWMAGDSLSAKANSTPTRGR
jgi:hypothetical protein